MSDRIASAVFGQPMQGHPMGASCAFTSMRDGSVAILRVWMPPQQTLVSADANSVKSADAAFNSLLANDELRFVDIRGIGDRAKLGNPKVADRNALQFFITQQSDMIVTVYAKKSQLLESEALALNVFHETP